MQDCALPVVPVRHVLAVLEGLVVHTNGSSAQVKRLSGRLVDHLVTAVSETSQEQGKLHIVLQNSVLVDLRCSSFESPNSLSSARLEFPGCASRRSLSSARKLSVADITFVTFV